MSIAQELRLQALEQLVKSLDARLKAAEESVAGKVKAAEGDVSRVLSLKKPKNG